MPDGGRLAQVCSYLSSRDHGAIFARPQARRYPQKCGCPSGTAAAVTGCQVLCSHRVLVGRKTGFLRSLVGQSIRTGGKVRPLVFGIPLHFSLDGLVEVDQHLWQFSNRSNPLLEERSQWRASAQHKRAFPQLQQSRMRRKEKGGHLTAPAHPKTELRLAPEAQDSCNRNVCLQYQIHALCLAGISLALGTSP